MNFLSRPGSCLILIGLLAGLAVEPRPHASSSFAPSLGQVSGTATTRGVDALPPVPTRDEVAAVKMTFQGLTVKTMEYGSIPWFTVALSSLNPPDRSAAYAALHAAGDTHLGIAVSWRYHANQGYSYPVPGRDLTSDLPTFRALVEEAIRNRFVVLVFLAGDGESNPAGGYNDSVGWTYGRAWLMDHLDEIVGVLRQSPDLTPYCLFLPGFDGVVPGWSAAGVDAYLLHARSVVGAQGHLGLELGSGFAHWGRGADNYRSPAGQALDVILNEFPGPPAGDPLWQVAARMLGPAYHRPPDQPAGNDRMPPFYLAGGTPRGRFHAVALEFDLFRFVRGRVTADVVRRERDQLRAIGYSYVG
jgi:hypothetical protein